MDHEATQALFSAYVDGELTAAERAVVDAHLAGCEACTAELATFRSTLAAMRGAVPVAPPDAFMDELKAQIRARSRGRFFGARRRGYGPEIASLVTLLIAVGVYVLLSVMQPTWLLR
ncbi:MAG: zf-HC2 domain-containing protein [Polyangia bacterium]